MDLWMHESINGKVLKDYTSILLFLKEALQGQRGHRGKGIKERIKKGALLCRNQDSPFSRQGAVHKRKHVGVIANGIDMFQNTTSA